MMMKRKNKGILLIACFLGLALILTFPAQVRAGSISVPWSAPSLSYQVSAEAGAGHAACCRIPSGAPNDYNPLGTDSGTITSTGPPLPVPSSGHTTAPTQTLSGTYHYNTASTYAGRISGDPAGTLRMEVGGSASAFGRTNSGHYNHWDAARAYAKTTFMGEFSSTGNVLDYLFSGQYDRINSSNPSVGIFPPTGTYKVRPYYQLIAHLKVENLTNPGTLFDADLFSSSSYFNVSQYDVGIGATSSSINLAGTLGDTIKATLEVSIKALAQVQCNFCFNNFAYGGSAYGEAAFDYFDIDFTTDPGAAPIPEPTTLLLLGSGLLGLGLTRRRKQKM